MGRIPTYKSGLLAYPNEGDKQLEYTAVIPAGGILTDDLFEELAANEIGFVQSVFIDNSDNAAAVTVIFPGINRGYRITVQPYHQGWFPVSAPIGSLRFSVIDTAGNTRTLIFSNVMVPYFEWGPVPGVLVTPALQAGVIDFNRVGDGTQILLAAGDPNPSKIYRMQFAVDNSCKVFFQDTDGNNLTGGFSLFPGGSITWQASGIPWVSSPANKGIQLSVQNTGGATIYFGGLYGYTQN